MPPELGRVPLPDGTTAQGVVLRHRRPHPILLLCALVAWVALLILVLLTDSAPLTLRVMSAVGAPFFAVALLANVLRLPEGAPATGLTTWGIVRWSGRRRTSLSWCAVERISRQQSRGIDRIVARATSREAIVRSGELPILDSLAGAGRSRNLLAGGNLELSLPAEDLGPLVGRFVDASVSVANARGAVEWPPLTALAAPIALTPSINPSLAGRG